MSRTTNIFFFFSKTNCVGNDGSKVIVDSRKLKDKENAVVTYHNPLDNVPDLARIFYDRCLTNCFFL